MPAILRNISKFNAIILFAGAITLALFYSMQLLIMAETGIPQFKEQVLMPDITMPELLIEVIPDTPKPEVPETPPEIPELEKRVIMEGPPVISEPGIPVDDPVLDDVGDFIGLSNSNAVPIAQIQPQYPARAAERGIEGFVIVEFDVNETGAVINPEVLVSVPEGVFDRASIRALERWRYQAKIVDGKAVPMRGLQTKFNFSFRDSLE